VTPSAYVLLGWIVLQGADFLLDLIGALEVGERFLSGTGHHPWVDDMRFWALLATGGYADHPEVLGPNPWPPPAIVRFPAKDW
jgi:hypothetical protein